MRPQPPGSRAQALITALQLAPHPEGGWYREIFRSADTVRPADGRGPRSVLTSIDFLLCDGERSAWHRVAADEVWHLLEGGPLRLWLAPPDLSRVEVVDLGPPDDHGRRPRHVVPAMWWQAAQPLTDRGQPAGFAYVGATVAPGFDFADFRFGRDDAALCEALQRLQPEALPLL
jgi:predicted cupin superfamily sugar epimerase